MAKDPAFLFYPNDWIGGTMTLTRHQKGCYIDLLIAQFNNGPLSLETIKTVLGTDQATWTVLSKKFQQDSNGNFSNERLATEVEKRKNFSQSRRDNINKRYSKPTYVDTSVVHMNVHMEDGDRNTLPVDEKEKELLTEKQEKMIVPEIFNTWKRLNPGYIGSVELDYQPCLQIAYNIADAKGWRHSWVTDLKEHECLKSWGKVASFLSQDGFFQAWTLTMIAKKTNWQMIENKMRVAMPAVKQKSEQRDYTKAERYAFKLFQEWINDYAPRVAQMKEPFTIDQYHDEEFDKYTVESRMELLKAMNNHAKLFDKLSAYTTFLSWKKMEGKFS